MCSSLSLSVSLCLSFVLPWDIQTYVYPNKDARGSNRTWGDLARVLCQSQLLIARNAARIQQIAVDLFKNSRARTKNQRIAKKNKNYNTLSIVCNVPIEVEVEATGGGVKFNLILMKCRHAYELIFATFICFAYGSIYGNSLQAFKL